LETIRSKVTLPISLSCQPFGEEQLQTLFDLGLDRVAIPLDAATEEVFSKVKGQLSGGPYSWHRHLSTLRSAVEIFGEGHVSTHLIVGLGESDAELIIMIQMMVDTGINPGLFAFTPIQGTLLEKSSQPSLVRYRRIQVARYLIASGKAKYSMMKFGPEGNLVDCGIPLGDLNEISASGEPFLTSGCPDCNRPFYNEKAGGPFYNYPRKPTRDEISQIITEMSFREG
jgi:biotin synthase